MRCPTCADQALIEASDLSGRRSGYCRVCQGRWCALEDAIALGVAIDPDAPHPPVALADCPRCETRTLSPLAVHNALPMRPLRCRDCGGVWLAGATLAALRVGDAPPLSRTVTMSAVVATSAAASGFDADAARAASGPVSTRTLLRAAAGVPALALCLAVFAKFPLLAFFVHTLLRMPLHELGHACAAWLSGHVAIPLPFFTPIFSYQPLAWLLPLLVVAVCIRRAYLRRMPYFALLAALMAVLAVANGIFAEEERRMLWYTFSGEGGTFVLGALLALLAMYRVSDNPRWSRLCWPLAVLGFVEYIYATRFWWDVAAGTQPFPYGSAFGGEGDMDALVAAGATEAELGHRYLRLALWCGLVLAGHWGWHVWRLYLRWPGAKPGRR